MTAAPRVSILIPVYNRERYIGACIESALQQTFTDLEVVVVDNASEDGTWEICQRHASRDARLRIFRNPVNLGPVRNWQRCLDHARGELAKLLFSDDLLLPACLQETVPVLSDPGIGLVFTAAHRGSNEQSRTVVYRMPSLRGRQPSGRFIWSALVEGKTPLTPATALFRTADLRDAIRPEIPSPTLSNFSQTGAGVDLLAFLLVAQRYPFICHLHAPLVFLREHAGSISTNQRDLVRAQVTQARIWFCRRFKPAMLSGLIVLVWLVEMRHRRRWLSVQEVARRYVGDLELKPLAAAARALQLIARLCIAKLAGTCSRAGAT